MVARALRPNDDWLKAILQPPCGSLLTLAQMVLCNRRAGLAKPLTAHENEKGRALRSPPLWKLALAAQGIGISSPPLPAQPTNLFDAACTSPGLEKSDEGI
jgi:hypothetical protein